MKKFLSYCPRLRFQFFSRAWQVFHLLTRRSMFSGANILKSGWHRSR
jgi:hypothetical protein